MLTHMEKLLLGIWRKAYEEGKVEVKTASKQQATRTRFLMYSLKKKAGKESFDFSLEDRVAMGDVCLRVVGETLIAENSGQTELAQAIEGALGGLMEREVEDEVAASQRRLQELLAGGGKDDDAQA